MVLQYLKELVGENHHPIIVDGKLILNKEGNILYATNRGNKFSIFTFYKRNEIKLSQDEIEDYLESVVESSISKYYSLTNTSLKPDIKISALTCKSTGALILKTPYYILLSSEETQNAINLPVHIKNALNCFLMEELINYYSIFIRILKPRISRINKYYVKAHLVQNLFVPFRVSTKEILCPFNYNKFKILFSDVIKYEEILSTTSDRLANFDLTAIAGSDFADLMGTKVYPLEPSLFIYTLLFIAAKSIDDTLENMFVKSYYSIFNLIANDNTKLEWFQTVIKSQIWKEDLNA